MWALIVLGLASGIQSTQGITMTVSNQILINDLIVEEYFGSDVSITEKYGVIGSLGDNNYAGSAYVFSYVGTSLWTQQSRLVASDGGLNDYFGNSVSNCGELVAIGAMSHDFPATSPSVSGFIDVGAVYLYESNINGIWSQQAKIIPPVMNSYDYFGVSVRVGHRTLVVGAFGENAVAINSGSAFVYDRTASSIWTFKAKLISSDAAGDDLFGTVVDMGKNDTLIAVTTYRDDGQRGSVYLFEKILSKWTQITKIMAADRTQSNFGISMRLHEDTMVVGAYRDQTYYQGAAYIFEKLLGSWTQTAKLKANDLAPEDYMGGAVALFGDLVMVNTEDDDKGPDSGAVYVFKRGGNSKWTQQMKLLASNGAPQDYFGICLALHGQQSLIAAPYKDSSSGAVYSYAVPSFPTFSPTISFIPTMSPTSFPTNPTFSPSRLPSRNPTSSPTSVPSAPTISPSRRPTPFPSLSPTRLTSSPTESLVVHDRSQTSDSGTIQSLAFTIFISIVGGSCLIGVLCCLYSSHKTRVQSLDPTIQMTQVVSVTPVNPHFATRHAIASAVLVPISHSPDAAPIPSRDLIFTNVVASTSNGDPNQTPTDTQPDVSIPVAMVVTHNP